jgi:hypothetical protein
MMENVFNAKVGSDNTSFEKVMGLQGLGEMNDNGERFTDLCTINNLVIGGTLSPTSRSTRQQGYYQITPPRTRSTICVSQGSFEDHSKTSESKEEPMLLQTTTS